MVEEIRRRKLKPKEVIPGTIYHFIENDELLFYIVKRVYGNKAELVEKEGDRKATYDLDYILNKGILLSPAAYINMSICTMQDGAKDVYVCVNQTNKYLIGDDTPTLVLRQNALNYDDYSNIFSMNQIRVGNCFTVNTVDNIADYIEIKDITDKYSVAYYMGDSQEHILSCVSPKFKNAVQSTLRDIKNSIDNKMVVGFSDSLADLMTDNDFMGNLYSIFNITRIDFEIDLGKESHNEDGDIKLNSKQINRLEELTLKHMMNVVVLGYDNDINVNDIVIMEHIVVADPHDKIFLIAYTPGGYIVNEDTVDVLQAMNKI